MKKLVAFWILLCIPGCAIGKLQDAAEALDKAEVEIDNLHVAECMSFCDDGARACFDEANGTCIDTCEVKNSDCKDNEKVCEDAADASCAHFYDSAYHACVSGHNCDYDCDQGMSDCGQECGNQLADCFFAGDQLVAADPSYGQCVSSCVKEMEETLKDIDL